MGRLVGGQATWISVDGDQIAFGAGRSLRLARGIDAPLLELELELNEPIDSAVLVTGELYVASGTRLGRLSLERPFAAPSPIELVPAARGRLIAARMVDYIVVAEDGVGVRVIELPMPEAMAKHHKHHGHATEPRQKRLVPLTESFTALTTSGSTIYAAVAGGGLMVIELDDEATTHFVPLRAGVDALAANGTRLFALGQDGLEILDLSDTRAVKRTGFDSKVRGSSIELTGRTIHVGAGDDGLATFFNSAATAGSTLVTVGDNFFSPSDVTVNVGDTVMWAKQTSGFHNVASCTTGSFGCSTTANEPFRSGDLTGATFTFQHTFMAEGSNDYMCEAHFFAGMDGNVLVEGGGRPTPPGVPSLTVAKNDATGTSLDLSFDTTSCDAEGHNILFGGSAELPTMPGGTYATLGAECGIGGSPYTWNPSASPGRDGLLWFLVVADDSSANEGSWGKDSAGTERDGSGASGSSGQCAVQTKDLSNTCGQ